LFSLWFLDYFDPTKEKAMRQEPRSELARYAFGYSDKKPGKLFWIIHIIMMIFIIINFVHVGT
jgi:hypothetical protein